MMRANRRRRLQAIEEEFGEPFRDTILGLREYLTWGDVAGALEMSRANLYKIRAEYLSETIGEPRKCYKLEVKPSDRVARERG
jgi:hypothetical protein